MTAPIDITPYLEAKSDQIVADDLISGPRTFRITEVETPGGEQPVLIHLEGSDGKPFKPCKGMRRLLAAMWGPDAARWSGRMITLFRDPDVRFGAEQTGGVRVAAVSHIEESQTVPIRVSRGRAKQYKVDPLQSPQKQPQDGARNWASGFIAKIDGCVDQAELDALLEQRRARLTELYEARPELHADCQMATDRKLASFGNAASSDEWVDDDMTDAPEPAGAPAWQAHVDDLKQRLGTATTRKAVDQDEKDWINNIRPFLPDDHGIIAEVEGIIARRKLAVAGKG